MPAVYNPTVARAVSKGTMDGQSINNVLHVDSPETWTDLRLQELANIMTSWWTVDLLPFLTSTYVLREIVCDSLAGINAPQFVATAGLPAPGLSGSAPVPNNVALAVSLKTGFRGRSGRGRWFLAGLTEGVVTASRVSGTFRDNIVGAFGELRAALITANMRPVVYSTISGGDPRPVGIAFPVTSFAVVDDVVDSQRRRLPSRGI